MKTLQSFDYETKSSYAIRIQATDSEGNSYQQAFTIQITDDTSEDMDGDGLTESQEDSIGTSDLLTDTDSDGTNDSDEVNAGSDPTDSSSTPITIALGRNGTGFFITEDGYLLTNHHVIEDALRVEILTGDKYHQAQVITFSAENDLALLKVNGQFQALPLASSDNITLGDDVFTMGYPGTSGTSLTYTEGVVNNLEPRGWENVFQISTQLHGGNSGGALVDKYGNAVGVVAAKLVGIEIQDINYAVKSNYALDLIENAEGVSSKLQAPNPIDTSRDENEVISEAEHSTVRVISYLNQPALDYFSQLYSWSAATDLDGEWKQLDWFSYYFDSGSNWIYHINLGWLYRVSDNLDSIWFWDDSLGWIWTNSEIYPLLLQESLVSGAVATWLYYHEGSSDPRYFYNYNSGTWEEE